MEHIPLGQDILVKIDIKYKEIKQLLIELKGIATT